MTPDGPEEPGRARPSGAEPRSPGGPSSTWWGLARFAAVGTVMAASVVAGLLVGMGLDRWLGTGPWLAVVGILLGSVAGFREMFRALRAWQREEERAERDGPPASG